MRNFKVGDVEILRQSWA